MFARGRSCLKRCGLLTILADHAASAGPHPDEALLFLYPRWFTTSVRQQRRSINSTSNRRYISHGNNGVLLSRSPAHRSPTRKQSLVGASTRKRWLSRGSKAKSTKSDLDEAVEGSQEGETPVPVTRTKTAKKGGVGKYGIFDAIANMENEGHPGIDSAFLEHNFDILSKSGAPRWPPASSDRRSRQAVRKKRDLLRHLPPPQSRKILRRQFYLGEVSSKERIAIYKQIRRFLESAEEQAEKAEFLKPRFFTQQDLHRREVLVPDETIAVFTGVSEKFSQSENIWFEPLRHGCRVHVLPSDESEGHNRKVILSGSARATELVADRLLKTRELQEHGDPLIDIKKPPVPAFPSRLAFERSGTLAPLIRTVWSYKTNPRPQVIFDLLSAKSENISTIKGFVEQVEGLVTSLPSTRSHESPHPRRVATALRELFCNESRQQLISTTALNTAISFLLQHGFMNDVQKLIDRGGHVATIETFNILLRSAAKRQNLGFFNLVLRVMGRLRVRPDVHTWLAYLECLISPAAKTDVVKVMEKKGYLKDPDALRSVLRLMIGELLIKHFKDGGSVDEFFNKIVETAGLNWFPASLIRKMVVVTAQLGDASAMTRILDICKENSLPLSSEIINDVIRFFPNDTFTALHYIIMCLQGPTAELNQEAYARLFVNARRNKHYNICRVLWRYACMNEAVSRTMRDDVTFLLFHNVAREGLAEQDKLWWTCAGKVIVGVDLHLPDFPFKNDLLRTIPPEFHDNPVASFLTPLRLEGEERSKQRLTAKAIVKHDVEIGPWYRPTYSLAHMLEVAAELDKQWVGVPRPAKWLMQNAIQVPVEFVGHNLKD